MVSLALDALFVRKLRAALEPFGDAVEILDDGKSTIRISKGGKPLIDITPAPIKSHARMRNKLQNAADHLNKALPRPKWNVDTVRGGIVVYDAAIVAAVYEAINAHVGAFVRVKNGFAPGAQVNYGYRAILGNLRLESGLTVEQGFGGEHRELWRALGEARKPIDGAALDYMDFVLKALMADSGDAQDDKDNASLPATPLNIAAEVQLIYEPYLTKGRKLSHLPYKVVRCDDPSELARDAGGKHHAAEREVKAAEARCGRIVT